MYTLWTLGDTQKFSTVLHTSDGVCIQEDDVDVRGSFCKWTWSTDAQYTVAM